MVTSGIVGDVVWAVVAVASLAVAVVGLRLAVGALPALCDLFRSATTDPRPAGEVSPGGYVEATGLVDAVATDEITAPFSGGDCVAYAYRIRQTNAGRTWRVAEGSAATEFVLEAEDGGGSVAVAPGDTAPTDEWETVATTDDGETLPPEVRAAIRDHSDLDPGAHPGYLAEAANGAREYQERRLDPGERLYAYGNCVDIGPHRGRIDAARSSGFALGAEPAGRIGGSLPRAVLSLAAGVVALAAGLVGLSVGTRRLSPAFPRGTADFGLPAVVGVGPVWIPPASVGISGFPAAVEDVGAVAPVTAGAGVLLVLAGGYVLWKGLPTVRSAIRIYVNQPVNPGEVASLDGMVELEGTARLPDDAATAALYSGVHASLCGYRVREQHVQHRRRSGAGHGSGTRTERRRVWRTVESGTVREPLSVEGPNGEVRVDPTGADLTLGDHETVVSRNDGTLPQAARLRISRGSRFGIANPTALLAQTSSGKRRFQERRLGDGDAVHVYGGEVTEDLDGDPLIVDSPEAEYAISAGTELRTVLRRAGTGVGLTLLGLALAGSGLVLTALGFGVASL
jgi:hypothetical protein